MVSWTGRVVDRGAPFELSLSRVFIGVGAPKLLILVWDSLAASPCDLNSRSTYPYSFVHFVLPLSPGTGSALTISTCTVHAYPVDLRGELKSQYRWYGESLIGR